VIVRTHSAITNAAQRQVSNIEISWYSMTMRLASKNAKTDHSTRYGIIQSSVWSGLGIPRSDLPPIVRYN
jgi:hypothetical protein